MKKVCVMFVATLFAFALAAKTASALPPISAAFLEKYAALKDAADAVDGGKCNVCHVGKSKKDKNAYGLAVGKFVTKAKVMELKEDAEGQKKYIMEGLDKAAAEKNAGGTSFGDVIKSGKVPGA